MEPVARLASRNQGKLRELRHALGWELEPLDADDYPPEDGASYYENARAKAQFGRSLDRSAWILGEDSGIEVEALGGRPGIHSARLSAGAPVEWLLGELNEVAADARRARYVCELVALSPSGKELRGTGVLEGSVAQRPRGSGGFGFDPIFVPSGEQQTVAELGDDWKARNSHRARAAQALTRALEQHHGLPPRGGGKATS